MLERTLFRPLKCSNWWDQNIDKNHKERPHDTYSYLSLLASNPSHGLSLTPYKNTLISTRWIFAGWAKSVRERQGADLSPRKADTVTLETFPSGRSYDWTIALDPT